MRGATLLRVLSSVALATLAACEKPSGPAGPVEPSFGLRTSGDAETARTSPPPSAATITVAPAAVTLAPGQTAAFTAVARDKKGRVVATPITWSAGGGTITSSGAYTAGSVVGSFLVEARAGAVAGTAAVQIRTTTTAGVVIRPGESIQTAVDRHPEGTTFVLATGIHRGQRVKPRNRQTFVGEPGAILQGDGVDFAFRGTASDVTIRGLVIEGYNPGEQLGAIKAGDHTLADGSQRWLIEGCEIRYNEGGGIRVGNYTRVVNNKIHHNSQIGIVGMGHGILVEGNEIAYNNWERRFRYVVEAGGTKFVRSDQLVVRNNWSHHNWGPGLWTDHDNIDVTFEGNLVEDNADTGIFHEIGYRAIIRNNTVRRNGYDRVDHWAYGAGILVAHSPNVEVYGNVLENNQNGIMGIQQERGSGAYGPYRLDNLYVHDNVITQTSGQWAAGVAQDIGDIRVFDRSLRFQRNSYILAGDGYWYEWRNADRRAAAWRSYGLDVDGTFRF